MLWICVLVLAVAIYPLAHAWRVNQRTTLPAVFAWAGLAWAFWVLSFLLAALAVLPWAATLRYLALCLTICAPIMVLGARRPGVAAWNFVVVGLLVTLLLPVAQGWGKPRLETPWLLFLGVCLGFCVLNYLPTRLGAAALLLGGAAGWELLALGGRVPPCEFASGLLVALAPWIGWGSMARRRLPPRPGDRLWIDFRDRFGVVWGQRVREQFNRAAENAALGVVLYWHGLENTLAIVDEAAIAATLQAVLKRFGLVDAEKDSPPPLT